MLHMCKLSQTFDVIMILIFRAKNEDLNSANKIVISASGNHLFFLFAVCGLYLFLDGNMPLTSFRINPLTIEALKANGITELFPIQNKTFDKVFDGQDMIGRGILFFYLLVLFVLTFQAKTGSGKTLSFLLPIIERLHGSNVKTTHGRAPRVLVLAPTRELAVQVETVAQYLCRNLLRSICVYGGTPMGPQCVSLLPLRNRQKEKFLLFLRRSSSYGS